jgi:phosphoribosylformylglycinamidine cyclo-ligase
MPFGGSTIGEVLLTPTEIYVKAIQALAGHVAVHGLAHITGGGIVENLPRVLPEGVQAVIDLASWQRPEIFHWLQAKGNILDAEMLRTFNCGIGMIVCVSASDSAKALEILGRHNKGATVIGSIRACAADARPVVLEGSPR